MTTGNAPQFDEEGGTMSTAPKVPKKAIALLKQAFTKDGKVISNAIDTDEGTLLQWLRLERAGLVKRNTGNARGILGHNYSFAITKSGEIAAEAP